MELHWDKFITANAFSKSFCLKVTYCKNPRTILKMFMRNGTKSYARTTIKKRRIRDSQSFVWINRCFTGRNELPVDFVAIHRRAIAAEHVADTYKYDFMLFQFCTKRQHPDQTHSNEESVGCFSSQNSCDILNVTALNH